MTEVNMQFILCSSDDMTGQFSLVSLEQPGNISLNFRKMSDAEQGPLEYYDEQNAAEELAGQVCMDDLASEGLLLIRMEPDERGRFGFNIKVSLTLSVVFRYQLSLWPCTVKQPMVCN